MKNNLIGRFIEIVLATRYNSLSRRICKIINSEEKGFTLVDVLSQEIYTTSRIGSSKTGYEEYFMLPTIVSDKGTFIKTRKGQLWWVEDFYLHRDDGPAIEGKGENKFYLFGQELTPEQYLDALPKDAQTDMLFHLDVFMLGDDNDS